MEHRVELTREYILVNIYIQNLFIVFNILRSYNITSKDYSIITVINTNHKFWSNLSEFKMLVSLLNLRG